MINTPYFSNPNPAPAQRNPSPSPAVSRDRGPNRLEHLVIFLCLMIIILPILAMVGVVMPGPLSEKKTVIIPHGLNVHGISQLLDDNGVVFHPFVFRLAAKFITFNQLKAGEYEFTPKQSAADVVIMMHDGRSVVHWFRAIEGLTSSDIAHLLLTNQDLTGSLPTAPQEGSLMPETYRYSYGDKRQEIIMRMQKNMQDILGELWSKRDTSIPLKSPLEAIILASVVEKETGKAEERPRIAGVFYNRLRIKMRLQSDPTVIYAISQGKGPLGRSLEHRDLAFISPINTYIHDGLPTQPICNPGRASLEAVLHPEKNDFLYFVADGTGGHTFAKRLSEHNRNVAERRRATD